MDKEYKGWEILKLLSEGKLKTGQELNMTYNGSDCIVKAGDYKAYTHETF